MNRIVVGVDIAKRVFQLHWVEPQTGEIVALQLKRERFLEHFANRSTCLIGMEACGGCARDLDGGTAARDQGGGGQARGAASGVGVASDA
jgi:transposase